MDSLDRIRTFQKADSIRKQILITLCILLLGIGLGTFSKFLDYRHGEFPVLLQAIDQALDFHNFLGGFAPWIVIAVCISVYSHTPLRAAVNVFFFFTGMVASYYMYSDFVAGFFPKRYAMIWSGYTIVSPLLAFLCWYAKGKGVAAFILSAGIASILINTAFSYGIFYIGIRSWLNLLMLAAGIVILHKSPKETFLLVGTGAVFAVLVKILIPIYIW